MKLLMKHEFTLCEDSLSLIRMNKTNAQKEVGSLTW